MDSLSHAGGRWPSDPTVLSTSGSVTVRPTAMPTPARPAFRTWTACPARSCASIRSPATASPTIPSPTPAISQPISRRSGSSDCATRMRMTFADDGRLFISETGWYSHEEINTGDAGANFGWPFFEGDNGGTPIKTPGYQDSCRTLRLLRSGVQRRHHDNGGLPVLLPRQRRSRLPGQRDRGRERYLHRQQYPCEISQRLLFHRLRRWRDLLDRHQRPHPDAVRHQYRRLRRGQLLLRVRTDTSTSPTS